VTERPLQEEREETTLDVLRQRRERRQRREGGECEVGREGREETHPSMQEEGGGGREGTVRREAKASTPELGRHLLCLEIDYGGNASRKVRVS